MPTNLPATWDNGRMSATTTEGVSLRHVVVVGGTAAEWALTPADQWADRLSELCKVADHAGANWLTVRPFGPGGEPVRTMVQQQVTVGSCAATVQPDDDGRVRLTRAIAGLDRKSVV